MASMYPNGEPHNGGDATPALPHRSLEEMIPDFTQEYNPLAPSVLPRQQYEVEIVHPGQRVEKAVIAARNTQDLFGKMIAGAFLVPRDSEGSLTIRWSGTEG